MPVTSLVNPASFYGRKQRLVETGEESLARVVWSPVTLMGVSDLKGKGPTASGWKITIILTPPGMAQWERF